MRNLRKKLKKQGGFTLVEMLIVVAIIAILVAVSIPIITVSLQKTQHATDLANERSAKMEIMAQYLLKDENTLFTNASGSVVAATGENAKIKADGTTTYAYDAANGVLLINGQAPTAGYGKCECGDDPDHTDGYILAKIDENGIATIEWSVTDSTLCSDAEDYKHE